MVFEVPGSLWDHVNALFLNYVESHMLLERLGAGGSSKREKTLMQVNEPLGNINWI